jgi:predicted negative regulator of RcsB-dependent stress response
MDNKKHGTVKWIIIFSIIAVGGISGYLAYSNNKKNKPTATGDSNGVTDYGVSVMPQDIANQIFGNNQGNTNTGNTQPITRNWGTNNT